MRFALQQADLLRARATANHFDPHFHSTYSIVALKRGTAEVRSARWSETARAGDVFFFNPYEVHSAICPGEDAEYETLYPSKELLTRCLALERSERPLTIETSILRQSAVAGELVEALNAPAMAGNSIEASLGRVLAACVVSTESADENPWALARRTCELIRNNCARAMRTEELARAMGVHKSHLVRAFSKAVGMPPQKYMRQVRVAKASELISEGSQLSEVALMLDFSDQAHFTREFKKVFGVPPGALSRDVGRPGQNKGRSRSPGSLG